MDVVIPNPKQVKLTAEKRFRSRVLELKSELLEKACEALGEGRTWFDIKLGEDGLEDAVWKEAKALFEKRLGDAGWVIIKIRLVVEHKSKELGVFARSYRIDLEDPKETEARRGRKWPQSRISIGLCCGSVVTDIEGFYDDEKWYVRGRYADGVTTIRRQGKEITVPNERRCTRTDDRERVVDEMEASA